MNQLLRDSTCSFLSITHSTKTKDSCTNAAVPSQGSRGSNKSSVNTTSQHATAPAPCCNNHLPGHSSSLPLAATGTAEFLLPATTALWKKAAGNWQAPHHQHSTAVLSFPHDSLSRVHPWKQAVFLMRINSLPEGWSTCWHKPSLPGSVEQATSLPTLHSLYIAPIPGTHCSHLNGANSVKLQA